MLLNQAEFAYLEYIRKSGGWYLADDLTRHYLGSRFGLSAAKFQEMHHRLVEQDLLAVASGEDPFNRMAMSVRVSITYVGEKTLKRPISAILARKRNWWNPRTWWH
jgi:hypothetical protein